MAASSQQPHDITGVVTILFVFAPNTFRTRIAIPKDEQARTALVTY
jgi:hypothetical protein